MTKGIIIPARHDAIRIVPLHRPDAVKTAEALAAAAPLLTYRGGPLLTNVEVFTIFWGSSWQRTDQGTILAEINAFFDFILTSPLLTQLGEYSVAGKTIGSGKRVGSAIVISPKIKNMTTDTAIQHMLQTEIANNPAVPQPGPNTLYFVYLPPGVRVVAFGASSCQAFCGYHSDFASQIFYAAMPYPGCPGCLGGLSSIDALTSTSSHELCEAITDPTPGLSWYDDLNGEIGDICAWTTKKMGNYTVQLEWSNAAGSCV